MNKKPLVIYHGDCADGFAAAYAFWHVLKDQAEYFAGHYGKPAPDVADRDVYLVDFSYPRDVVEGIIAFANSVTLIDHHVSAIKALADVQGLTHYTDLNRSGAVLAWNYLQENFFLQEAVPLLFYHIQDRDLWKFDLSNTLEIMAGVFSYEFEFERWQGFLADEHHWIPRLRQEGEVLIRQQAKEVKQIIRKNVREMDIAGFLVPVANTSMYVSETCAELAKGRVFAASYYDTETHRIFSLRSEKGKGLDVAAIAAYYGGGGHKNAAGFSVSRFHILAKR
jgi:oligoribonuclease NrnB/cAMP/cGMP phosphodiesterase (DHH superfamily)